MLTPRRVILAAVALLAVSVTAGVISLLQPPDSSGLAADTYGTRHAGQRGLFETLRALDLPVERSVEPPGDGLPTNTTVVLWGPDPNLVATEPRHLQRLRRWVEQGGRVVVAPSARDDIYGMMSGLDDGLESFNVTIWDALDLDGVSTTRLEADDLPPSIDDQDGVNGDAATIDDGGGLFGALEELAGKATAKSLVDVEPEGSIAEAFPSISAIAVPAEGLSVISSHGRRAQGVVTFQDQSGIKRTLVAEFEVGKGEIVVVGDPMIFANFVLAIEDNSVLATWLLAGGGNRVVFDEFYHGLSVRGNPLWLLTHPSYALLTVALIALVAVATWRSGILLGPPLTSPEPSRRTVGEYVDAMSRFFNRGRKTRLFLLEGVCSGVVWKIAREHGLHKGVDEIEEIANVVERRNAERAGRLRRATANVDALRAKGNRIREHDVLQAMSELSECL